MRALVYGLMIVGFGLGKLTDCVFIGPFKLSGLHYMHGSQVAAVNTKDGQQIQSALASW